MTRDALISDCRLYRYHLTRVWDKDNRRRLLYVMLNPSTADASKDDPTVKKCIGFAERLGFGGLAVVNLFAFRSTKPGVLKETKEPVGPQCDRWILDMASRCDKIIVAWGAANPRPERAAEVVGLLEGMKYELFCLGTTDGGQPRHPLYVAYSTEIVGYRHPVRAA